MGEEKNPKSDSLPFKIFQYLGYFPVYNDIPKVIVAHIRTCMKANETIVDNYKDPGTLYKHRRLVLDFMQVLS
jgi:hypothetical protein